jgi:hypothetical protein
MNNLLNQNKNDFTTPSFSNFIKPDYLTQLMTVKLNVLDGLKKQYEQDSN